MIAKILSGLLATASPGPCSLPESMPEPSEAMAGFGDADWCLAGDDIFAAAGPDAAPPVQMVYDGPAPGGSVVQWRRGQPDPAPAEWRMVASFSGKGGPKGEFNEILIQRLADNVVAVTVNPAWRVGNAICTSEAGPTTSYLPITVTPTSADRGWIEAMPRDLAGRQPGNIICLIFTREDDGYTVQFRGPQGRPFPEFDDYYAETRVRVTAPGDLPRQLRFNR